MGTAMAQMGVGSSALALAPSSEPVTSVPAPTSQIASALTPAPSSQPLSPPPASPTPSSSEEPAVPRRRPKTSRRQGQVEPGETATERSAKNPKAYFYQKPITIEDHQNSRWIAEPLRLLDCCQETDGAVALVVTSAERAKDLKHRPAIIEAASQGASPDQYSMVSYYRPELGLPEMGLVGKQLWQQSGLKPTDIQTAILYDHFTPFTLIQLEELGFCGQGEAKDFIADGAIEIGGRLPINTHGGQLGEAYIHGMNGIAEGVRQLRGTSVNQVRRRRARARHRRHRRADIGPHPGASHARPEMNGTTAP